jgi:hypothetical protein
MSATSASINHVCKSCSAKKYKDHDDYKSGAYKGWDKDKKTAFRKSHEVKQDFQPSKYSSTFKQGGKIAIGQCPAEGCGKNISKILKKEVADPAQP